MDDVSLELIGMKKLKDSFIYLASLSISLLGLGLIAWGGWYFFRLFISLQPVVQAALVTATLGFTSLIITNIFTSQREINLKITEKKVEVYSKFVEGWITTLFKLAGESKLKNNLNSEELGNAQPIQEFSNLLLDITDDLILWGSDDIIKKYSEFRENLPDEQSTEIEKQLGFIRFAKFILDIRKDIGHKNK